MKFRAVLPRHVFLSGNFGFEILSLNTRFQKCTSANKSRGREISSLSLFLSEHKGIYRFGTSPIRGLCTTSIGQWAVLIGLYSLLLTPPPLFCPKYTPYEFTIFSQVLNFYRMCIWWEIIQQMLHDFLHNLLFLFMILENIFFSLS